MLDAKTQGPQVSILCRSLPWFGVLLLIRSLVCSSITPSPFNVNLLSYSIASHSNRNLMKASNLGVVFGPTLMRPERESVASIVDLKYQNIIVEMMISEMEKVSVNHFVT